MDVIQALCFLMVIINGVELLMHNSLEVEENYMRVNNYKQYRLEQCGFGLAADESDLNSIMDTVSLLENEVCDANFMSRVFPNYGTDWMLFPDGDGNLHIINLTQTARFGNMLAKDGNVFFHLYTRNNPKDSQLLDYDTLSKSNFDVNKRVVLLIHGWTSSYKNSACQQIKDAYLSMEDLNVICVDWNEIASDLTYIRPVFSVPYVGNYTAGFLDGLVRQGARPNNIHLIGHSLGAHVSGFAGKHFNSGRISRITGLDPALPAFFGDNPNGRLSKEDADFVDVIHTCGGLLGFKDPLGHADFYPNKGTAPQPGCFGLPPILNACSHGRAIHYYAESIENNDGFKAALCETMDDLDDYQCRDYSIPMGPRTPHTTRGIFYLRTNREKPWASSNFLKC